jgi:hypothetical protein
MKKKLKSLASSPDLLNPSQVVGSDWTRMVALQVSSPSIGYKVDQRARPKPPPLPGPCGDPFIQCLSGFIDKKKWLVNPIRLVSRSAFNPYIEMQKDERLSITFKDKNFSDVTSVKVSTKDMKFGGYKLKRATIDINIFKNDEPYLMLVSDEMGNLIHVSFKLV